MPTSSDGPDRRPAPVPHQSLWRVLLGDQFRQVRQERGESQGEVARRANISTPYLSEIERGRKEPSSEIVAALGEALGLTLLDLTTGVADQLRGSDAPGSSSRQGFLLAA